MKKFNIYRISRKYKNKNISGEVTNTYLQVLEDTEGVYDETVVTIKRFYLSKEKNCNAIMIRKWKDKYLFMSVMNFRISTFVLYANAIHDMFSNFLSDKAERKLIK